MTKTIVVASLTTILLIGLAAYFTFEEVNKIEVGPVQEEIATSTSQSMDNEEEGITIVEVEIANGPVDYGVYVLSSTGTRIKIAESDNPETIEDYFNIVTYHQAFVSPNKEFVALQGSRFEDSFVVVYDAQSNTLHEREWGRVVKWTTDGLLKVDSCDLSGEICTYLISSSAEEPWRLVERQS